MDGKSKLFTNTFRRTRLQQKTRTRLLSFGGKILQHMVHYRNNKHNIQKNDNNSNSNNNIISNNGGNNNGNTSNKKNKINEMKLIDKLYVKFQSTPFKIRFRGIHKPCNKPLIQANVLLTCSENITLYPLSLPLPLPQCRNKYLQILLYKSLYST